MGIEHIATIYSKEKMEEMIRVFKAWYERISNKTKTSNLILDEDWGKIEEDFQK